jgi:hypothetical protein
MSSYIGTFLLPIRVTGTWNYQWGAKNFYATDYGYVHGVAWMGVLDAFGNERFVVTGTNTFASVHDDTFGYIYAYDAMCRMGYNEADAPYKVQVAYDAGLPTGTASYPTMLLALTMAAQISLNEMVFPFSNESSGDVGVTEFRSLNYAEKRKGVKSTAFGHSAKASKIASLVDSFVKKARRAVMV